MKTFLLLGIRLVNLNIKAISYAVRLNGKVITWLQRKVDDL